MYCADVFGLRAVEHDEIAPAGRLQGLAGRGLRFLVLDLAVDDGREALTGIPGDVLPHVQDRPARRVDQRAAEALEPRQFMHRHAEGRDDHHVALAQTGRRLAGIAQEPDACRPQLLVDVGVVDDFAGQEHPLVGEPLPGLVGIVDRAIDAVAEAELPRQVDGQPALVVPEIAGSDALDDVAVVVARQVALDGVLQVEALAEDEWLHHSPVYG